MARYIDADRLIFADGGNDNRNFDFVLRMQIDNAESVDAVPTDFHDRCMQTEIHKRIELEKIASLLCEGYLDMPSGCDGCPLVDTMVLDDEGNAICDLYRR